MGRRVRRKVYTRQADTTWSLTRDQVFVYDGWSRGGAERRRDGLPPLQRGQQGDASRPSTFPVLVLDATDSNAVTRTFTWGLDLSGTLQGAGGIGGLLRLDDTDDVYFYTCDANGNISELIDDSGNTDAHYEYTPFGSQVVATGPCAAENPFRFSTKYHEEEIELYYYGFRYYSPDLGRWLNRDPIDESGHRLLQEAGGEDEITALMLEPIGALDLLLLLLKSQEDENPDEPNLYGFVLNSPCNLIDPDGLKTQGLVSWKPIPRHAAILIDSCHCKGIFGFAPASLVPNPSGYWTGQVSTDPLSSISNYVKVGPEGNDDCFEKFLCDAISASQASPPDYHFSYYNCWSWVWDMIGDAAVQEAIAEVNGECCEHECE
jgi:RHS repeat-associated protein